MVCVVRDTVLQLSTDEDFGESKADGVTILVEVLVLPLGLSVHNFMVDVLAVHDQVVLDVVDEVPGVGEGLGHLAELVQICANGSLALLELIGDVVDDVTKVFDSVQHRVERAVLKLFFNASKTLPNVLCVSKALDTVGHFGLNRTGQETFKNLAHAEEGEMDIRALHLLEQVHLLILLVINLIEQLLPVVGEIVEELLMVNHLGLAVKDHGRSLTKMLASVEPLAHAVVVETLTSVLKNVDSVDDERLSCLEQDLLRVEVGFGHPLNLLVVVMVDFAAVIKHVTDVRDSKSKLIESLGSFLV